MSKEVCAFNVLQNNGYIKYSEETFERYVRDEDGEVVQDEDNFPISFIKMNYIRFKAESRRSH